MSSLHPVQRRRLMRHILLHHHLFKNAGSTFDWALKQFFGETFLEFHSTTNSQGRVYPQELLKLLEEHSQIRALSSHHFFGRDFNYDLKNSPPLTRQSETLYFFHDCVLIRHPVARLVSMYTYFRTLPKTKDPLSIAAHELSLHDFLNLLIGSHPNVIINAQVTIFGAEEYGAPPSSENLERALVRLKKVTVLGTVEEYAKTMVIAEYFLQPLFAGIQLHYPRHENVSNYSLLPGYNRSLESMSLESIKEVLGASYFSDLCDLNDLDIELWHAVSKELRRRASYIKDFSERFNHFTQRCSLANTQLEEQEKQQALSHRITERSKPSTASIKKKKRAKKSAPPQDKLPVELPVSNTAQEVEVIETIELPPTNSKEVSLIGENEQPNTTALENGK